MAEYINTITNEYPLSLSAMELRFPNFDENNVPSDYAVVTQPEIPVPTNTQSVKETEPVLFNGVWTKQYVVIDYTGVETTTYINTSTNEYPLYPGDMELRFPNFDKNNVPEGYAVVVQPEVPVPTNMQAVNEVSPILIDGVWTKQYVVITYTEEELVQQRSLNSRTEPDLTQAGSAPNVIE